jgi:ankyrin repeat protein
MLVVKMDLAGLRKQAKRWLKALRAGDAEAFARLGRALPKHSPVPGLREVQQALAHEHGFESWAALKEQHEGAGPNADLAALADEFLQKACMFSGGALDFPQKWRRAERILALRPEVAKFNLHTATVCGELEHARRLLAEAPERVHEKAGPQRWEPLLCLCYSRLPNERAADAAVAMAELLLHAGADPNTWFTDQWKLRYSALCGVMGQGEMGAPEHTRAAALAKLLLDRGADPNESQGLYDTCLTGVGDETKWLELLFDYGLKAADVINWDTDPEGKPVERILDFLLVHAARSGHQKRLELLLGHGADANAKSRYNGKSCYQNALLFGNPELAEILLAHGATREPLVGREAFVAACSARDRSLAERLLEGHPEYLEVADPLIEATTRGELNLVELLLDLGMDPNRAGQHGHRALNEAATNQPLATLLLARGADPRGRAFGSSAAVWAKTGKKFEMARWLAERSRDILDAVASGHVELARELVHEYPACVNDKTSWGGGVLHELPADLTRAEALIELLLPLVPDPYATNDGGKAPLEELVANGSDDVADALEVALQAAAPVTSS